MQRIYHRWSFGQLASLRTEVLRFHLKQTCFIGTCSGDEAPFSVHHGNRLALMELRLGLNEIYILNAKRNATRSLTLISRKPFDIFSQFSPHESLSVIDPDMRNHYSEFRKSSQSRMSKLSISYKSEEKTSS